MQTNQCQTMHSESISITQTQAMSKDHRIKQKKPPQTLKQDFLWLHQDYPSLQNDHRLVTSVLTVVIVVLVAIVLVIRLGSSATRTSSLHGPFLTKWVGPGDGESGWLADSA